MKRFFVLFIALLIAALGAGCSSTPVSQSSAVVSNLPEWFNDSPHEDVFWGIGIAKLQNDGLGLETAASRARRDVAATINALVQAMLTDYAREAGLINDSSSIQSIERIGRDIINTNLSGATPNARTRMQDGTWYVRVVLRKADAKQVIMDVFDNEAARYADFKAQEALKMLDAQLEKSQVRSTGRDFD